MNKEKGSYSEDTIDLRKLFRLFLKRKWWFIGTVLIVLVVGMIYTFYIPVLYEVRYNFSLKDDFIQDDFLQYSDAQEKFINNETVFIGAEDILLIFKTDLIFSALEDIPEIDNYETYVDSSLIRINLYTDTGIFYLRIKNPDKKLAKEIALKLIESLGTQIKNQDIKIFDNTLEMINKDIEVVEEENAVFEEKISDVEQEINSIYYGLDDSQKTQINYDIMEKKGELLLYKEKIISNEYEIKRLNDLYQEFTNEKNKVDNRIEIITEEPSYSVENDRMINSIIVILLSILSGIVVVLAVNYIYKLKSK